QQNATQMAVDEINESGGLDIDGTTYMLELETVDDESDPTVAVTGVQRLLSEGVKYMVGTTSSAVLSAYIPVIQGNEDFISIVIGGALETATENAEIYRPRVTLSQYTNATVEYIDGADDIESVALLTDQGHAGWLEQIDVLKSGLDELGVDIVAEETYKLGATDFGPQLTAILRSDPDAINVRGFPEDGVRAAKQARELGFEGPILNSAGFTRQEVEDAQAAEQMNNVFDLVAPLTPDLVQLDMNENAGPFNEAYEEEFGEAPGFVSGSAYDGVYILARALEKAGTVDDVLAVRDALDDLTLADVPELVEVITPQEGDRLFEERQAQFQIVVREWVDDDFQATDRV
ncbi:MAG TPA: ABC transporter substrate-binding protein, partial [Acidimicrobiales bacterium]|nr:ABC transporter substrate-binding protein [Acidimicrobiales bacterium]